MLQKFEWHAKNNKFIGIEQWISTLSEPEQKEYWESRKRQDLYRQQAIGRNDMILTDQGYVWQDEESAKQGKESDEIWEQYFNRWLNECDITFHTYFEEIK